LNVNGLLFGNIRTLYPTTQLNIPEDSHNESKVSVLINTMPEMPYVEVEVYLHFFTLRHNGGESLAARLDSLSPDRKPSVFT
jgi:hypothetical protein